MDLTTCPCLSGKNYADCCYPLLSGARPADSPERLMRSRYSAYVVRDVAYLLKTWHSSTRPDTIDHATIPDWKGLAIIGTETAEDKNHGVVEFYAHFHAQEKIVQLHERSRFVKEKGQWYYVDGDILQPSPKNVTKVGRNAPCPCGSGKKFKKCCGP